MRDILFLQLHPWEGTLPVNDGRERYWLTRMFVMRKMLGKMIDMHYLN